jgi:GAF domain-containing protein
MEPLPETREALAEFTNLEDPDPEELLNFLGTAARRIVPELTGLSLALARDQLTFTLVASSDEVAALDAAQYLDGGPCVEVGEGRVDVQQFSGADPLDEERWHLFANATAAHGVASTLSLPVYDSGDLIGSVNLYAATPDAFTGRVQELAGVVGATPTEAIRNADLSFSTRLEAVAAPQKLRDQAVIDTAIGLVAVDRSIDVERARQHLLEAAARAGVHLVQVARVVISVHSR